MYHNTDNLGVGNWNGGGGNWNQKFWFQSTLGLMKTGGGGGTIENITPNNLNNVNSTATADCVWQILRLFRAENVRLWNYVTIPGFPK